MQFTHLNLEVSNLKFLQKNSHQSRHFSLSIGVHASLWDFIFLLWGGDLPFCLPIANRRSHLFGMHGSFGVQNFPNLAFSEIEKCDP